jgi:hypothetical protein
MATLAPFATASLAGQEANLNTLAGNGVAVYNLPAKWRCAAERETW